MELAWGEQKYRGPSPFVTKTLGIGQVRGLAWLQARGGGEHNTTRDPHGANRGWMTNQPLIIIIKGHSLRRACITLGDLESRPATEPSLTAPN